MIDEKIKTVIDLGKSNIKIGIFDNNNKIIYSSNEEIETFYKKNNISKSIKKVIRKSEKEIYSHIDKIALLLDDLVFTIDLSIKKNNDQIQTLNEIQYSAFLDCSQIINKFHKNITIVNFLLAKL